MRNVLARSWPLALIALVAAVFLFVGRGGPAQEAQAASPGGTPAPLLRCPNVDASPDNKVAVGDILAIVQAYFNDWPATDYYPLYDLVDPYNPSTGLNGKERVDDILAVVNNYFVICPLADTQVAAASKWGIQNVPVMENAAALHAMHYYEASNDVPGQGTHYINLENWDGNFNPAAPEGLVYTNGRIAAQLYVADGTSVGWGTHAAPPCGPPCAGAEYNMDLEGTAGGPLCNPDCSWHGSETWHLHHYLCTVHIGTTSSIAIPGSFVPSVADTQGHCASYAGEPQCAIPVTTTPCYMWAKDSGWMGHLWNWLPNDNQISDVNATMNGRFADCFPDTDGWKAHNCPG